MSLRERAEALMIGGLVGDTSPELQRLSFMLYRLLAEGDPVDRPALAEACELTPDETEALLAEIPDSAMVWETESIVAFGGLSLRSSDHAFEIAGRRLHTWCVFDGLFLPGILGHRARITTRCPATDSAIEVEVGPAFLGTSRPANPLMSIVAPGLADCARDLRGVFCHHVRFFVSAEAFADWAGERDDIARLSLTEAFDLAGRRNAHRFAAAGDHGPQPERSAFKTKGKYP
ncbi:MAG TPA: organomercurial lyase [Alphaproteobacteria bacterium]|jgi:alkylmercury lyase|nr:organomercurial lyase [Alphaproteobacteria bacterium]MDP6271215.1 organomercurial lyase [Alphaproteobacteria bacterium]HJM52290.1 organomercurial lyase [Alphaproteobacteria bacterium]